MENWVPVIATLAGTVLGGGISLLIASLSNRRSLQHDKLAFAEERARWATERHLDQLRNFYGHVERLFDATQRFRIQQAWENTKEKDGIDPPGWVASYSDARQGFEDALHQTYLECCLLDSDIERDFECLRKRQLQWLCSMTREEAAITLHTMEDDLMNFRKSIADRYRVAFDRRRAGTDASDRRGDSQCQG
jgi:hypothetical protein